MWGSSVMVCTVSHPGCIVNGSTKVSANGSPKTHCVTSRPPEGLGDSGFTHVMVRCGHTCRRNGRIHKQSKIRAARLCINSILLMPNSNENAGKAQMSEASYLDTMLEITQRYAKDQYAPSPDRFFLLRDCTRQFKFLCNNSYHLRISIDILWTRHGFCELSPRHRLQGRARFLTPPPYV